MTMIVALHLGAYALIAADKRETYQLDGKVLSVVSDDIQKLIEWSGGVVTGSGYVPLLNDFKVKLGVSEISNTDQIFELARECSSALPLESFGWKKSTNWLFTYLAEDTEGVVTRVAFIQSASPKGVSVLEENKALIWAKIPDYENQIARLNSNLKPEKDISNIRESLSYHLSVLKELYAYVASVNPSVSANFECFLHAPEIKGMVPNTWQSI